LKSVEVFQWGLAQ
jgi:hypothetical protein